MKIIDKILHPRGILYSIGIRGGFRSLEDKKFLQNMYKWKFGRELDLDNPKRYNEKLQWLKLYNRNPLYTKLVDKYAVKEYVAEKIGEDHVIPTIGCWEHFDEINFDELPDQFVLKCTHDSGGLVICKDKSKLDRNKARSIINKALGRNYYWIGREWPYKDVKPRIIAEKYLEDKKNERLYDYKFLTFNGGVKAMYVWSDRHKSLDEMKLDFFDTDFNHLPLQKGYPNSDVKIQKPVHFEEMKEFAEKLSEGIPHVRADFYEVEGKVYFGELTFYDYSGFVGFTPDKWDKRFGDWITLPKKRCNTLCEENK